MARIEIAVKGLFATPVAAVEIPGPGMYAPHLKFAARTAPQSAAARPSARAPA